MTTTKQDLLVNSTKDEVIRLRLGFPLLSQGQIGLLLDISRQRVQQILTENDIDLPQVTRRNATKEQLAELRQQYGVKTLENRKQNDNKRKKHRNTKRKNNSNK